MVPATGGAVEEHQLVLTGPGMWAGLVGAAMTERAPFGEVDHVAIAHDGHRRCRRRRRSRRLALGVRACAMRALGC